MPCIEDTPLFTSSWVFPRDRDPSGEQLFPLILSSLPSAVLPVRMAVRVPVDNSVDSLLPGEGKMCHLSIYCSLDGARQARPGIGCPLCVSVVYIILVRASLSALVQQEIRTVYPMAGHDWRHHPLGPTAPPAVCGEAEPEHLDAQLRLASAEPHISEPLALFSHVRDGSLSLPV